ncbi:casein kinase family protein [Aspergillus novofumigatus IBT 16806]|uniref:Uncharacterized protein n=1 Tax=Aspergillus novofumigatus (strain IBT 16806) TaxID=1392255 RepID=A0A2I1BYQ7_ASPN1|nr:uncharacterized protein P174DRAFT_463899 [Aspergillus novofumigatus IBT 16806]PKX90481.1 hypothetical protein P174DRAFT_463899 [Aspergillus novofumigatus IBT 16806]
MMGFRSMSIGPFQFEIIDGKDIMVTDMYGPTLDEFIYSRNIIHGNLNPLLFVFGCAEWQKQQVILVDLGTEVVPAPMVCNDLQAISCLLLYFYSLETTVPVLMRFSAVVASHIFYDAYHGIVLYLEIAMNLRGPQAMGDSKVLRMGALAGKKTIDLFKSLGSALSHIGQLMWLELLDVLEEKRMHAMGVYYLPNRLWRDLCWFLKVTANLPRSLQLSVTAKLYHYLVVLYEVIPLYRLYWVKYLLFLAHIRKDLEPACGKPAWT